MCYCRSDIVSIEKVEGLPRREMGYAQKIRMKNLNKAKEILLKVKTENPTLQEPDIRQIAIKEICNVLMVGKRTSYEYYDLIT